MKLSKDVVKHALQFSLAGDEAHREVMIYQRLTAAEARSQSSLPRESAVMMLLYEKNDILHTVFVQRPDYEGVHSGQIGFPGGKREPSDNTLLFTALRETLEEVGVMIHPHEVIGQLSELYIPPSNFLVQPFVAWLDEAPAFVPDEREVRELLEEPVLPFLQDNALVKKSIYLPVYKVTVESPAYEVSGRTLWGATAMMMREWSLTVKRGLLH